MSDIKSVHLVIPDLILPNEVAAEASQGLRLPILEKMLGRGRSELLDPVTLEDLLCVLFGMPSQENAPIAPISAAFDGLGAGCWLRADPVHLRLQRDQMLLLPKTEISAAEAASMCASLNEHFAGQGMEFFAPHPQRWYVRLRALPSIRTRHLSQVTRIDVRSALPTGEEAPHWHRVFNEIQMLLFAHPINETREARGEPAINSVWFWGAGCSENVQLKRNFAEVRSDDALAAMFALAAGVQFSAWVKEWRASLSPALSQRERESSGGSQLLVWTGLRSALMRGDLAAWQSSLQDFEDCYAQPLWLALRSGDIAELRIDIPGADGMRRTVLTRGDTWAFWRRNRRLADYSLV
jgi:hypothetical protein